MEPNYMSNPIHLKFLIYISNSFSTNLWILFYSYNSRDHCNIMSNQHARNSYFF